MTRSMIFSAVMTVMMAMTSVNASAQGRNMGGDNPMRSARREFVMNGNNRGGHADMNHGHKDMRGRHADMNHGHEGMRGGHGNHDSHNRNYGHHDNYDRHNNNYGHNNHRGHHNGYAAHTGYGHDRMHMGGRYIDRRWEGRIRYDRGRWGYYRDSRWYWYDIYFEPDYYFCHPVRHFHVHLSRAERRMVGAVAGTVAVGALITALCR